jgi:hypothetical protein
MRNQDIFGHNEQSRREASKRDVRRHLAEIYRHRPMYEAKVQSLLHRGVVTKNWLLINGLRTIVLLLYCRILNMQYNILQYLRLIQQYDILQYSRWTISQYFNSAIQYIAILQVDSTIYCNTLNGQYIVLSTIYCNILQCIVNEFYCVCVILGHGQTDKGFLRDQLIVLFYPNHHAMLPHNDVF